MKAVNVIKFTDMSKKSVPSNSYCVLGAVSLAKNLGLNLRPNPDDLDRYSESLSIPDRTLRGLIHDNDTRHWSLLTKKLVKLNLYDLVRPLAVKVFKNKTVTV
jgi:hypothetical protein